MALEESILALDTTLKALLTALTSSAEAQAQFGTADAPAERKTRAKKADTAPAGEEKKPEVAPTPAPTPSAPAEPTTGSAAVPAAVTPSASPASTSDSALPWSEVYAKLQALNKGKAPYQGREGLLTVLNQFLPNEPKKTVPLLEALGKNAEIAAAVDALLAPETEDLGI